MSFDFSDLRNDIESSLLSALPESPDKNWISTSFSNELSDLPKENFKSLLSPNRNLLMLGGKRWRPLLMMLCYLEETEKNNKKPAVSYKDTLNLTPLVEFVHTASLIHDDIEDGADLRRGKPAAHITFGLDTALNSASWLYFEASHCIQNAEISEETKLILYKLYTTELRKLHLGQALDIKWHRDTSFIPSEEEYFTMVSCKTGTLSSLAAKAGSVCAGNSQEKTDFLGKTAAKIGIGFQIIDDVINLTTGNPGKKRGDDIVEGKKSLPVILHLKANPKDKEKISSYMQDAKKNGINSQSVEECIFLLNKSGAINEALKIGKEMILDNVKLFESEKITELFNSMIPQTAAL